MAKLNATLLWALMICFVLPPARAEDVQFLPQFNANYNVDSLRLTFEAKGDREAGNQVQFQMGPSVQFYLKPLIRLKHVTAFDLNDAKSRFLVFDVGYLDVTAPNAATINRMVVAVTANYPLKFDFLISDRNRADLDWQKGAFTWRYRNKFTVQRALPIRSYHIIPYGAVETYFESEYSKVSTTSLYAGSLFPVGKHVQFDAYYEHENNTGKRPNKQDEEVGLSLNLYYGKKP
jgi:hypothetical protein